MPTNRCKKHGRANCSTCRPSAGTVDDLTNPASPLYQATYGSTYDSGSGYGSNSCETGSSSSSDSGSSSHDSGNC